jgi:hypothetical protein
VTYQRENFREPFVVESATGSVGIATLKPTLSIGVQASGLQANPDGRQNLSLGG